MVDRKLTKWARVRRGSELVWCVLVVARVRFLLLPGADHWLELVTPSGEESKLSNALRRGVTLHHLCYEVPDVDAAIERLRDTGMLLVGEPTPGAAFGGRRVAWLMDRTTPLVELVEAGSGPFSLAELRSGGAT